MFKFSKKVEYSILALQYMAIRPNETVSTKEIAGSLQISFEFLSKVLQVLMKNDLIQSHQGIRGGYDLAKSPTYISISNVLAAHNNDPRLVECIPLGDDSADEQCCREDNCHLKGPISKIQQKVMDIFDKTTIAELCHENFQNKNVNELINIEGLLDG